MKLKTFLSYLFIAIGGAIAFYANATEKQNILLLVIGIITLMVGLYMINVSLTSKIPKNNNFFKEEEE